jgi:zinc transport system substrate-binding protein
LPYTYKKVLMNRKPARRMDTITNHFVFTMKRFNSLTINKLHILLWIAAVTAICFGGLSCTSRSNEGDKVIVSVSILPQKFIAERIAGDDFHINVLVPSGSSPETYDPSPRQIEDLHKSAAYLKTGYLEIETIWLKKTSGRIPHLRIIDTSTGISLIEGDDHCAHHGGIDPHLWMSAKNMLIISRNMLDFFVSVNPGRKGFYQTNYETLATELRELDETTDQKLSGASQKRFLIYHPALAYFARDYGLHQIALEHEGKEPSVMYMRELTDLILRDNIRFLMIQNQFDTERAAQLARETGISLIRIDPLDYEWRQQYERIADIISGNFKL